MQRQLLRGQISFCALTSACPKAITPCMFLVVTAETTPSTIGSATTWSAIFFSTTFGTCRDCKHIASCWDIQGGVRRVWKCQVVIECRGGYDMIDCTYIDRTRSLHSMYVPCHLHRRTSHARHRQKRNNLVYRLRKHRMWDIERTHPRYYQKTCALLEFLGVVRQDYCGR